MGYLVERSGGCGPLNRRPAHHHRRILAAWRETQRANHWRVGDDDWVFTGARRGTPLHPDLCSQTFDRHVGRLDIPRIRLHDLRHTHATLLLKDDVLLKVVSERIGHSSPAFTMATNQHVLPGMGAHAAASCQPARRV
jgi:integrase